MGTKLHIPSLGQILVLTRKWNFNLFYEDRNMSIINMVGIPDGYQWNWSRIYHTEKDYSDPLTDKEKTSIDLKVLIPHKEIMKMVYEDFGIKPILSLSLPKSTELKIERIYIRNGCKGFDSMTFRIKSCPNPLLNKKKMRFWVKLQDANKIECDFQAP